MRWRRLGMVFKAAGQRPWMQTHAQVPFGEALTPDRYRIYFTTRDAANRSHSAWLDIDPANPMRVLALAEQPLLAPSECGLFDARGAMGSWLTQAQGKRLLYYIGWSVPTDVPFHTAIGAAELTPPGTEPQARRVANGPLLERSRHDPYFCSNPCVLHADGRWRMWYLSGLGWHQEGGRLDASYNVRYAESDDGLDWNTDGEVALDLTGEERAIARPCVLRDADRYRMWFCVRSARAPYRIAYAESTDGRRWSRLEDGGLAPSGSGFDADMTAYPFVFDHGGNRFMLYNGGRFGADGMGIAVWEAA